MKDCDYELDSLISERDRYKAYFDCLCQWVKNDQEGRRISDKLKRDDILEVGIYGINKIGELLYEELISGGIKVQYIIDQSASDILVGYGQIKLINLDRIHKEKPVPLIIISAFWYADEIRRNLSEAGAKCNIFTIEELVYTL